MQRHNSAWADSLRYRKPELDRSGGLRRITLNHNRKLGDEGALFLVDMLWDDLWLKALDLQSCDLTDRSAKAFLSLLTGTHSGSPARPGNQTLIVLDLRRNSNIS
ncbi:Centrosomal protein of 78 kDa [Cichlidogyrus casuarinus]|uniref:Centrosomal protein of 78 kDa n=1 Tax=Cichlidogyrus casuarinus TaxID=1844966 RepID=A0ABD2QFJ6_9PLAT